MHTLTGPLKVVRVFTNNDPTKYHVMRASAPFGEGAIAVCDTEAHAEFLASAPEMYDTIKNLLEWAKGNKGSKEGNPYCKPEIVEALKLLAKMQGVKDYLDADTNASKGKG